GFQRQTAEPAVINTQRRHSNPQDVPSNDFMIRSKNRTNRNTSDLTGFSAQVAPRHDGKIAKTLSDETCGAFFVVRAYSRTFCRSECHNTLSGSDSDVKVGGVRGQRVANA